MGESTKVLLWKFNNWWLVLMAGQKRNQHFSGMSEVLGSLGYAVESHENKGKQLVFVQLILSFV